MGIKYDYHGVVKRHNAAVLYIETPTSSATCSAAFAFQFFDCCYIHFMVNLSAIIIAVIAIVAAILVLAMCIVVARTPSISFRGKRKSYARD